MATDRGAAGRAAASKRGQAKSIPVWKKLIVRACIKRDIDVGSMQEIFDKVMTDAFTGDMHLGYTTVDSYVGFLQATNQLPGVASKYHGPLIHATRLNLKKSPRPDGFDPAYVWGKRVSSSKGVSFRSSRYG